MPQESCPERRALAHAVVAAIAETYRAKAEHDMAKRKRLGTVDSQAVMLFNARAAERAAERALREHINQHEGCSDVAGAR